MADWADLTSTVRRTKGDCPPPLVGASVTLVGESIYVFGGRPVHSREMVNSLYSLDLRSLTWSQLWPPRTGPAMSRGPAPRYFHSAHAWGDKLVVFGGQTFVASSSGPADAAPTNSGSLPTPVGGHLETLDELVLFNTRTRTWQFPSPSLASGVSRPTPRYAHLGVVSTVASQPAPGFREPPRDLSRLIVIGGQDCENNYLPDMVVLDLDTMEWVAEVPYPRKAGTYRSAAAVAPVTVVPREERMGTDGTLLVHSAHAVQPVEDREEPVWVYSNSNFASPRRDLDLIPTMHDSLRHPAYRSVSDAMEGEPALPPGLRFPHAYVCGRTLVLTGAHVGADRAEFVVWSLDLGVQDPLPGARGGLAWSALPLERVLGKGSWGPAVGWRNTLVVLGDASRDMLEDYNGRQTNFTQVAFVDLEGFGIFIPPPQSIPATQQQLSLLTMSQPQLFDFEIISSDRERLGCSRKLLEARWPWFAQALRAVEHSTESVDEVLKEGGTTEAGVYGSSDDEEPIDCAMSRVSSPVPSRRPAQQLSTATSRNASSLLPITSRTLELPLLASDIKALLQYFHTLALSTPQQRSLPVLSSLLVFTKTYDSILPSLRALVIHALHEVLSVQPELGAKVYEAAALGDSVALQVRAMQVMLGVRRGSVASTAQSVEPQPPAGHHDLRLSDQSHGSSMTNLSNYTGFDHDSSRPYNRSSIGSSSASSLVNTAPPSSTGYGPSASNAPVSPLAQVVAPARSASAPVSKTGSPNLSLPVTAGSPLFSSASTRSGGGPGALPQRQASLGTVSSRSTPSPLPPSAPLPSPPTAAIPPHEQLRRASSPTPSPFTSSTPARIAEAWREGEERDRYQRAEAARLTAEADLARSTAAMRLGLGPGPTEAMRRDSLALAAAAAAASEWSSSSGGGTGGTGGTNSRKSSVGSEGGGGGGASRKGSFVIEMVRKGSVASANTLDSIPESYGPLNGALNGGGFASNATPSLGSGGGSSSMGDSASIRTSTSGETGGSAETAAAVAGAVAHKAAETTAKVVKKGLFSGLMGPTIHNAGTTKKGPTGPAPKRAYPRPTPRTAKGAQALARLEDQFEQGSSPGSSSSASFQS